MPKSLFDKYYRNQSSVSSVQTADNSQFATRDSQLDATRAYVEAMSELSSYYTAEDVHDNREMIDVLTAEEANLLNARQLARANGW